MAKLRKAENTLPQAERDALVTAHLKLVYWVWRTRGRRHPDICRLGREDAVQAGFLGLVLAARKYRADRPSRHTGLPVQFCTYARWWIYACMGKAVYRKKTDPPALLFSGFFKFGAPPWESHLLARDADPARDLRAEVEDRLAVLPPKWRAVIELRYLQGLTLDEVGGRLGVCRERARQLELAAMRKLRERAGVLKVAPRPDSYRNGSLRAVVAQLGRGAKTAAVLDACERAGGGRPSSVTISKARKEVFG